MAPTGRKKSADCIDKYLEEQMIDNRRRRRSLNVIGFVKTRAFETIQTRSSFLEEINETQAESNCQHLFSCKVYRIVHCFYLEGFSL